MRNALLASFLALSLAAPPAAGAAVRGGLPGVIHCAGNHCTLEDAKGRRWRVVVDRLPHEVQRRLALDCPVTRGCAVRVSGVVDPHGALQARAVLVSDV